MGVYSDCVKGSGLELTYFLWDPRSVQVRQMLNNSRSGLELLQRVKSINAEKKAVRKTLKNDKMN